MQRISACPDDFKTQTQEAQCCTFRTYTLRDLLRAFGFGMFKPQTVYIRVLLFSACFKRTHGQTVLHQVLHQVLHLVYTISTTSPGS